MKMDFSVLNFLLGKQYGLQGTEIYFSLEKGIITFLILKQHVYVVMLKDSSNHCLFSVELPQM